MSENPHERPRDIEKTVLILLRKLGVSRAYKGYDLVPLAVRLVVEDPSRIRCATNDLFPLIEAETGVNRWAIERNIRTVSRVAWRDNREILEKMAGFKIPKPPTPIVFLDILALFIERTAKWHGE